MQDLDYMQIIINILLTLAAVIVPVLGEFGRQALVQVRKHAGEQAEKLVRDALHQALETGVKSSIQDGATNPEVIAAQAAEYAKRSSPGKIEKLHAPKDVLLDIAKSKVTDIVKTRLDEVVARL